MSLIKFAAKLEDIGIKHTASKGYRWYKIDLQFLKTVADQQKWVHELDVLEDDAVASNDNPLDAGVEQIDYKHEYLKLKKQMSELMLLNSELREKLMSVEKQKETKEEDEIDRSVNEGIKLLFD